VARIAEPAEAPAKLAAAVKLLQDARARDPKNVAVGAYLSEVLVRQGKRYEGVAVLRDTAKLLTAVDFRLRDAGRPAAGPGRAGPVGGHDRRHRRRPDPRGAGRVLPRPARGRPAGVGPPPAKLLEEAGPNVARVPTFYKKAMVGLGACYAAMQNPDKQLEYCRRARAIDPGYAPAVVGEAEALTQMRGKLPDALREYRVLVNQFQLTGYRADLARLELLAALSGPARGDEAAWERFDAAVEIKKGEKPADVQARLPGELQVVYADARGRPRARSRGAAGAAQVAGTSTRRTRTPRPGTWRSPGSTPAAASRRRWPC
jgi:tetratricopeptide (TPR) repeat protein